MKRFAKLLLLAVLFALVPSCKQITLANPGPGQGIKSQSSAVSRAIALTGLNRVSKRISARRIIIANDNTPFLAEKFERRDAWCVEFDDVALTGKVNASPPRDTYEFKRKFVVWIDAKTGQLMKVQTDYKGDPGTMKPEPEEMSAEAQLKSDTEKYTGLPTEDPKINFLDAINSVLAKGLGFPMVAKEINGLYVMDSVAGVGGVSPRPVWIITLRGLPQMHFPTPWAPPSGKLDAKVPDWYDTTSHNVVDARTGVVLFATNFPQ